MNNCKNKLSSKTFLMMSIATLMLLTSAIVNIPYVQAETGDLLLEINNPTPEPDDRFGWSVAETNDIIIVGAHKDNPNSLDNAGTVYLYDADGTLLLTIDNPTPEPDDRFGWSVAETNDIIIVGAYGDNTNGADAGTVYLYDTNGNLLQTINNPTPQVAGFGISVASTTDGNILVGASLGSRFGPPATSNVYLFDTNGNLLLTIDDPGLGFSSFGFSITGTTNGNILVGALADSSNGINGAGSAHLFDGNTGNLLLTLNNPEPEDNDYFGSSVAGTTSGNLLVSAYFDSPNGIAESGTVYLFDGSNGTLLLTIDNPTPEADDYFGFGMTSTTSGNIIISAYGDSPNGIAESGTVYLFDGSNGTLLLTIDNPTPEADDHFGVSIVDTINGILVGAIFDNVGATDAGSVYLFEMLYCGEPESFYNVITGTDSADYLIGTNSPDLMFGYGGNDLIKTRGNNNCIYAGDGNDFVLAANNGNTVYGGTGDDSIQLKGTAIAYGENGDDTIYILNPVDGHLIDGGSDSDLCVANMGQIISTINCEIVE